MSATGIPYVTKAWNPITGCTPCGPACEHCWAKGLHDMRHWAWIAGKGMPAQYARPFSRIQFHPDRLCEPLSWRKPQIVAVCFGGDLGHPDVQESWASRVLGVMQQTPQHTYLLLSKRPEGNYGKFLTLCLGLEHFPHIVPGVTVWDQKSADRLLPELFKIPSKYYWTSVEPMLGPVGLRPEWLPKRCAVHNMIHPDGRNCNETQWDRERKNLIVKSPDPRLDWLVCGGESGRDCRMMDPDWAWDLAQQCERAVVPFYMKQMSHGLPIPEKLRIQRLPEWMLPIWRAHGRQVDA